MERNGYTQKMNEYIKRGKTKAKFQDINETCSNIFFLNT